MERLIQLTSDLFVILNFDLDERYIKLAKRSRRESKVAAISSVSFNKNISASLTLFHEYATRELRAKRSLK